MPVLVLSQIKCICYIFLVLLCCSILSSCDAHDQDSLRDDALLESNPTAQPVLVPSGSEADQQRISLAVSSLERAIYVPLVKQFMAENPSITVQIVDADAAYAQTDRFPAVELAKLADVTSVAYSPQYSKKFGALGLWLDLAAFINGDSAFDSTDFYTGTLEQVSDKNHTYAIPYKRSFNLLFYNKQLWQKHNFSSPTQPFTWPDMVDAARSISEAVTPTTQTYGMVDLYGGTLALHAALENLGMQPEQLSADSTPLDSPDIIAALGEVANLADEGVLLIPKSSGNPATSQREVEQLILDGQIGMFRSIGSAMPLPYEVGVLPDLQTGGWAENTLSSYAISAGTQHAEAAWKLISFLSRTYVPTLSNDVPGEIPTRRSIATQAGFWQKLDSEAGAALEAMLNRPLRQSPVEHSLDQHMPLLIEALQQIINGGLSVERAAAEAQQHFLQKRLTPLPTPNLPPFPVPLNTPVPQPIPATRITFFAAGLNATQLDALADSFQQEHQIQVDLVQPSIDQPFALASAATSSDCIAWTGAPTAADAQALLDLQPLLDAAQTMRADDFPPALLAALRQGSKQLGLPLRVDLPTLRYHAEMLPEDVWPSSEWTLADLQWHAQEMTDASAKQYGFGVVSTGTAFLDRWLQASGVSATQRLDDVFVPRFTEPAFTAALRSYVDFVRSSTPNQLLSGYMQQADRESEAEQLRQAGKLAYWFGNTSVESDDPMVPFPLGMNGDRALPELSGALYMSAQTQHANQCWQWFDFLSHQPDLGDFPARRSTAHGAFTNQNRADEAQVYAAYESLLQSPDIPVLTGYHDLAQFDPYWLYDAVNNVLQGADLERELANAQTLTETYLACTESGMAGPACAVQVDAEYTGWQQVAP